MNSTPNSPIIAISGNYSDESCTLAEGYYKSVLQAGGIPVIIPPFTPEDSNDGKFSQRLAQLLDSVDALILSGGGDMNPLLCGEEPVRELHSINPKRDEHEIELIRLAYNRQVPMLGICRGIQMINFALGGTIYQDIYSQQEGVCIKHSQDLDRRYSSHTVEIEKDSMLYGMFSDSLSVNSFHHQACKEAAPCLKVVARSKDGVIEAVESNEFKSIIGVQWHPEPYILRGCRDMMPLFEWLVHEATEFKAAKQLHSQIATLDSHCDTPMLFGSHGNEVFNTRTPLISLPKMQEGRLDSTIMVAYLEQKERDDVSLEAATAKANRILTQIEEMVARNCTEVDIAYTPDDVYRLKREGKRAIFLGIENGYAIGKDLSNIEAFRRRGVTYMTLCHNGNNDICGSCKPQGRGINGSNGCLPTQTSGVTPFGEQVIREMNRVGMMIDLSHASEESFYDALRLSAVPIVCSHSSARALCDHPRNLTDAQMRALADKGGVAQVTMYHGFLKKDSPDFLESQGQYNPTEATILTAIEHLNHMVNVMGIEHVGIGTDFDGDGGIRGCAGANELINFTRRLLRERYSPQQIEMIWGGNFMRVMREVQRPSLTLLQGVKSEESCCASVGKPNDEKNLLPRCK